MSSADFVPRGLRREDAARYIGISPTLFDRKRKEGAIPPPRDMFGVMIWDRHDLDSLFAKPVYTAANDNNSSYWDKVCGFENQST
ncbi:helix-turn-helix transcriptional regulator [Gellertiella hungarica]|uniref:DNA-binding protein n=1 Tax=Gellertiella hungarica TaxID=1572859 RepID=A0A7W6NIE5_9HYPH|nr:hypothetical protein [Gellertiella hungarica]MBB4063275.1 hypothetical protein [Gellertiella hungarica]